jgi:hypothetical protein
MKKYYLYTEYGEKAITKKPIKVGEIVIVRSGIACGNKPHTITRVTKVNTGQSSICCEAINSSGSLKYNSFCGTKIKSWFESILDIRPANEFERKEFFARKFVKPC